MFQNKLLNRGEKIKRGEKINNRSAIRASVPCLLLGAGFWCGYLISGSINKNTELGSTNSEAVQACFSPRGGCESLITKHLNAARVEILVQAYALTSESIADALLLANKNGVTVRILCDRSQSLDERSKVLRLSMEGINIRIDSVPGIAHNKVIILDRSLTITGSYNWSVGANLRNAENLLFLKSKTVSKLYFNNWKNGQKRSTVM